MDEKRGDERRLHYHCKARHFSFRWSIFNILPRIHNQGLNGTASDITVSLAATTYSTTSPSASLETRCASDPWYSSTASSSLSRGHFFISDPEDLVAYKHKIKLGIHSALSASRPSAVRPNSLSVDWAQHGICGRGVLLDMVDYYTDGGKKPLHYDPWMTFGVTVEDLEGCAKKYGITFQTGDILLIRVGFMQRWWAATRAEREALSGKPETL